MIIQDILIEEEQENMEVKHFLWMMQLLIFFNILIKIKSNDNIYSIFIN